MKKKKKKEKINKKIKIMSNLTRLSPVPVVESLVSVLPV